MDIRKGVVVSRTNLIDSKKEFSFPWKGASLIILLTLGLWVGAFVYNDNARKKVTALQGSINAAKQGRNYEKIALVADSEDRLKSLDEILGQRIDWEKLFQKIEENTLPEITFSNMEAKVIKTQNNQTAASAEEPADAIYQLTLKGSTVGVSSLAKQIAVFSGSKSNTGELFADDVLIQKIDMKKTESGAIDKGGALDFTIQININPKIIKISPVK